MRELKNFSEPDEIIQKLESGNGSGPDIGYGGRLKTPHSFIISGAPGMGKSTYISHTLHELIKDNSNEDSFIVVDPKAEHIAKTYYEASKSGYEIYILDFKNKSSSPMKYNPLRESYKMYRSDNPVDRDRGENLITVIAYLIIPDERTDDKYWNDMSRLALIGGIRLLFEKCDDISKINLVSVYDMLINHEATLEHCLKRGNASDDIIRSLIAGYSGLSAQETKSCLKSIICRCLGGLCNSSISNREFTCTEDSLDFSELTDQRKFILYVILPDINCSIYYQLSAILISSLVEHFYNIADQNAYGLTHRLNFIIEEAGSIPIYDLDRYFSTSRSRNIRFWIVCQDYISQLTNLYGEYPARTICSDAGCIIAFANGNMNTMNELSQLSGTKIITRDGLYVEKPLLTASDLSMLGVGKAFVFCFIHGLKYVYKFPCIELEKDNKWKSAQKVDKISRREIAIFDIGDEAVKIANKRIEEARKKSQVKSWSDLKKEEKKSSKKPSATNKEWTFTIYEVAEQTEYVSFIRVYLSLSARQASKYGNIFPSQLTTNDSEEKELLCKMLKELGARYQLHSKEIG